jgi:hypothetical protein
MHPAIKDVAQLQLNCRANVIFGDYSRSIYHLDEDQFASLLTKMTEIFGDATLRRVHTR